MRLSRIAAVTLFAAVLPGTAGAQDDFEGTIVYEMSMSGMSMTMTQHVKGKRMRQEMAMPMGSMTSVIDFEAQTMSMMMPGQGVQTMTFEQVRAMAGEQGDKGEVSINSTGEKETIAGHECEHYLIKQGDDQSNICVAKGLGFAMASMGTDADEDVWAKLRKEFEDGFLPLKMTMETPQGSATMIATSVERKSLSDDLFNLGGQE